METIITAIVATGIMWLIAAAVLTITSKLMYVKVDETVERLRDALPGANCGACGFSGCDGYAAALAKGEVAANLCPPGGEETYKQLSEILGIEGGEGLARKYAVVCCAGDMKTKSAKMEYVGIASCYAEEQLYGGKDACSFGCLGYGDCAAVCPSGAICIIDGTARVDMRKCIGCVMCVKACPRGVIAMKSEAAGVAQTAAAGVAQTALQGGAEVAQAEVAQSQCAATIVLCQNTEKGAVVRKKCQKGCIACGKCVR